MSNLILNSEPLNRVLDGNEISLEEAYQIYETSNQNLNELFQTAQRLRRKNQKNLVTFSKKAFFNVVNLCRDTCTYCTYKADPGEEKLSMMSKSDIIQLAKLAKKYRCVEALFVTGERPEERFELARRWLKENGFVSTPEYIIHASEIALSQGLFPHTNAGNLTKSEMSELKKTNVSLGLMLENSSDRLTQKGMPHHLAPSKNPKDRVKVIENAGELQVPITTGLLIGIGETPNEIINSIFEIKKIHKKFKNIQEVILQNFHPKQDTIMSGHPPAEEKYFKTIVALTRIILPEMNIQIPPNLSPTSYQSFLDAGINDWGGISPLTPDYVNPEFSWPQIKKIEKNTNQAGFELKARFPVYPDYFELVNPALKEKMQEISDEGNFVKEEYWR